jgi:membrane-associated phospholipid phosphatase
MKKETYIKMTETVRNSSLLYNLIYYIDKVLTLLIYVAYPIFLVILLCKMDSGLFKAVLVPGISFVALSMFRKKFNAPRPYEVFGVPSAIRKDTSGKSFPSRHVFSIFVIGVTISYFYQIIGVVMCIAGILLAIVRVTGGVHFTKDVIAGALIGIICGLLVYIF